MTKKILLASIVLLQTASSLFADPITLSKAKQIAAPFVKTGSGPNLVKRQALNAEPESQPIYIFSRGEHQGFVLVSGNDALPEIIGYTESGDFDENNLPPALEDMIAYYSQKAEALANATEVKQVKRSASGTKDIPTLMTTHWHQSWPYNNLCPYIKETTNRAATGCVATASSQIIYYWHKDLDDRTKYNTPTYGYGDAPVTESIPSGTPLKWDLMQDSYGSSDPEESTTAVATLVACVGASGWLTYGSSTAGQISDQVNVLSAQFGLNGGTTVWKSGYSQSNWEKMIIQDLEAGRPILYSGVSASNGGHAVVIDGYQLSTNTFHFNFGWGAGNGYDGYYTVDDATGMNGFNESQGMVWHIYPKKAKLTGTLSLKDEKFISRISNEITAKITNKGTLAQSGFYLYCLTGTNTPSGASSAQASDTKTIVEPGASQSFTFSFTPSTTNSYTLYLCDANKNILDKITGIETLASVADLTLNGIRVDDGGTTETLDADGATQIVKHVYNSKKANVTANFTNGTEGTICAPSVKGILYVYKDGAFVESTTKTKKNVTFEVGATDDITYDFTGLTDGNIYKFALAGTASTNKSYDIHYNTGDSVVYFKLVGANLSCTESSDGNGRIVTGNYNSTVFATIAADSTIAWYDMTQVVGARAPFTVGNVNALLYFDASQGVAGRNIIADYVCQKLELTPGYNFFPREDFFAQEATYHATQAIGKFGTALLPFDAEVPSGMFVRKVNLIKTGYLQEVDSCNREMKSGTPYIILSGNLVDITASNVPVSISQPSLGTDTLKGTWVNVIASDTQYVLDEADTQYFNTYTGKEIPALTAYLEYNKKVRATSYPYNTKDKKAKQLAQQIAEALAVYEQYADVTPLSAQNTFMSIIHEAQDSLCTQPITSLQSAQINALIAGATQYTNSASSTADNGYVDKTAYISNPSFETGTTRYWTTKGTSVSNITSTKANYMVGADGSYVLYLPQGRSAEQTLSDIANGTYLLQASVAASYGNHITLYAGERSITAEATDFGPMYFSDEAILDEIEVKDGTLTIGVKSEEDWAKVDNFRLYLTKSDETPVEEIQIPCNTMLKGIYDLSGRRYSRLPDHGIYIVDGKKIIQ